MIRRFAWAGLLVSFLLTGASWAQPLEGLSVEELKRALEENQRMLDELDQIDTEQQRVIDTIDGMIEGIDETIEQYAPYTNFEPIPLLGVDAPPLDTPLTGEDAAAAPTTGALPTDPMAFNSWCFNLLLNLGARSGYPDALVRDQAGFAMADARVRFNALGEAAGMDRAALDAFEEAMFAQTISVAQSAAAGTLNAAEQGLYDACRAKGLRGARYKALYVDPIEGMHTKFWCTNTFDIFDRRQMIGGGPERVARAQRALAQLEVWLDRAFKGLDIPEADRNVLKAGYFYRSLVQVEAFNISQGDKTSFEQDYEVCFPMEALRLAADQPDPPASPPDRPALLAAGWNYPLSFDFRFYAWCYGAMQYLSDGNMPADSMFSAEAAEALIGDLHVRLLFEALKLGLNDDTLATMEVESYHQAAYEFTRPYTFSGEQPVSYSYQFCQSAKYDVGAMLDMDNMQTILDSLQAPALDAEFNDAVWCLAGLDRVLGSETDREKRAALQEGLDSFGRTAAQLGSELGLDGETMMGRLSDMKPVVDAEIRTRRRDDGQLMIANCLEQGLGYSDVFYNWVDP